MPLSKNYHRIKVASTDGRNVPLSFPSVRLTMPKGGGHKKKSKGGDDFMASTQSRGCLKDGIEYPVLRILFSALLNNSYFSRLMEDLYAQEARVRSISMIEPRPFVRTL
ncbi:hypothetical protein TNCT_210801 [Trichonephila clavata]|uniref:Uncharacterized protein n=1 Tax=Trichonephila clavata TaxID=2740835 RepID=A0A8X6M0D7_TRICU|nr:hypothetical protein TNCT_210801 [Trichonephila clavata]